jgi:hypothetical protein
MLFPFNRFDAMRDISHLKSAVTSVISLVGEERLPCHVLTPYAKNLQHISLTSLTAML